MNKQQLASRIWESANRMRSKIEANEYKDYILGFMFYKYLSDTQTKFLIRNDYTEDLLPTVIEEDVDTVQWIKNTIGYFISYENLFSTWLEMGRDFDVANVRDAISAFNRHISSSHRKVFDGIFDTLQTGLSKLGDSAGSQTRAISDLIHLIKDIPMDERQDYDTLGFIYEYLIEKFASNAGKKAGEFYTPSEVSLLMSEIVAEHLKNRDQIEIYDPTSGSGSLLINIGKSAARYIKAPDRIKYYAQELKQNTYNLTRMNLVMRGILPSNIETRNGDTLEEDWPYFDENDPIGTYDPLYVDAVVSNPPYSQPWDPTNKESDERYAGFGLAPRSRADYAFLLHDLYHIKPDGIMTIVLPHGVLFRGGQEGIIRKNLIERNHIDCIIGLPANIFYGTGIPTIIIVLKKERAHSDVLMVDASKGFIKEGRNNKLRASDIKRIVDTVIGRSEHPQFSRIVSREEIRENEYNLNIPRYVDSSEKAETWDIYASMFGGIPQSEIDELSVYWDAFPGLKSTLFVGNGTPSYMLTSTNLREAITENPEVISFKQDYAKALENLPEYMKTHLIRNVSSVDVHDQESVISSYLFDHLKDVPLIDRYEVYQMFSDQWPGLEADIEVLQTEGFDAAKRVDPNMIVRRRRGVDQEVQEGWIGRIMPFDLVQQSLLQTENEALETLEIRLNELPSEYEEIIESLTEEEREGDYLANNSFVRREVTKTLRTLMDDTLPESVILREKLVQVDKLMQEERSLRSQIRKDKDALHAKTKETIEQLTDEQVEMLLEKKWIIALLDKLNKIPGRIIDELVNALQTLENKYAITLADIDSQITETETELASMIDDLIGSEFDMKGLAEFKTLLRGDL